MEANLEISKIHKVFDGEFIPGPARTNKTPRHSDCFVLYLHGSAEYIFDEYTLSVKPQTVFYLAKGSRYHINVLEKCKYIYIDFDFNEQTEIRRSCIFKDFSSAVKNDFTKLFHIWGKRSPWYFPQTLSILYNIYSEAIKSENKKYVKSNELFSRITSYILENYANPNLSVSDISGHIDISEVHLRRICNAAANISPNKYINLLRLEKAKNLLTYSNYTISEIAFLVGFTDQYYFSRLFKDKTGFSPTEYRKSPEDFDKNNSICE